MSELIFNKKYLSFSILIFSVLLFSSNAIISQTSSQSKSLDSLKTKFQKDSAHIYREQNVRPWISFDDRKSFIATDLVDLKGLQLQLIFHEKHTIGLGFYSIQKKTSQIAKVKEQNIDAIRYLSLGYVTFFYDYTLLDKKHFEIDVQVETGVGNYDVKIQDTINNVELYHSAGTIKPFGAGVGFLYKPTRWVGIEAMMGYRHAISKTAKINFSGVYYSLGLSFDLRQIYRDIRFYWFKKPKYKKRVRHIMEKA